MKLSGILKKGGDIAGKMENNRELKPMMGEKLNDADLDSVIGGQGFLSEVGEQLEEKIEDMLEKGIANVLENRPN